VKQARYVLDPVPAHEVEGGFRVELPEFRVGSDRFCLGHHQTIQPQGFVSSLEVPHEKNEAHGLREVRKQGKIATPERPVRTAPLNLATLDPPASIHPPIHVDEVTCHVVGPQVGGAVS